MSCKCREKEREQRNLCGGEALREFPTDDSKIESLNLIFCEFQSPMEESGPVFKRFRLKESISVHKMGTLPSSLLPAS